MTGAEHIVSVTREALYLALLVSLPPLCVSLLVGLVVSLFQATTQIQDQTLSFVPKLVAVLATLAITGPWIGTQLARFSQSVLAAVALIRP